MSDRKLKPLPPDPFRHQDSTIAPLSFLSSSSVRRECWQCLTPNFHNQGVSLVGSGSVWWGDIPKSIQLKILLPSDRDDNPSFAGELSPGDASQIRTLPEDIEREDDERYVAAKLSLILSPLEIKQAGLMKVRAVIAGETVKLGRLAIIHRPKERPSS